MSHLPYLTNALLDNGYQIKVYANNPDVFGFGIIWNSKIIGYAVFNCMGPEALYFTGGLNMRIFDSAHSNPDQALTDLLTALYHNSGVTH